MSTQLNLDNNNPLSGVASSAKPDERYLVMLNGEAQIWDADRYNRNAQQLYADHAEDALAFKLDDGGGDLKAVLRQQLSAMEGVKDRYREAITGAQTYKDLLSIPGLAESQYLVTLGDEQQVWDAARLQRNGDRLMSDHPEAQISQLSYKDYWYDKALADEESIKTMQGELEALNQELGGKQRWSPEYNAIEAQINEKRSQIAQTQSGYDANPRVVEAKAKYDAEYAAALEEYKKNYLPNLRSQINAWKEEEIDKEDSMLANIGEFLSAAADPMDRGVIARGASEAGYDTGDAMMQKEKVEQFDTGLAFLDKAERLRNEHSSFAQGFSNWAQSVGESKMTQSDLDAYTEIYGILRRLEDKLGNLDDISEEELMQNLSKSEQALILGFFEYNAAQAEVQDSTGWAYKAGQIAGEAVPFILEFIATGGLTKAATKGATKGLSKALTSWIKKATKGSFRRTGRRIVAKGVRGAARGVTQAAMITPLRPTAYTNVAKAMTQTEDGKLKDSAKDVVIAIADEYIETLSELSGEAITSVLGGIGKGAAKKFLSKSMYDTFATWGRRLAKTSGVKLLKRTQFHGLPVEVAEEYFGNALREIYDAKALDKMHEDGNFAAMLLGFAPLTVLGAGVGMGQYVNAKNRVNKGAARLRDKLVKDGFNDDQIEALVALEKELSPYSLAEKLDPVLTSMAKAGASKESRDAVIKYAMDVVRFKTLEGTVEAREATKRQEKLDELTGKLGTFYQTKNEGTQWQENVVTQATLYDGRNVFLTSEKNEMGEFAAVDAETGETLPVSESDIALVENTETGESSLAVESQSLDTYLTSLIMSERKTAEEMRMADERATQIAALQERLKADARLNIGTSDAPVYIAYLPEQSNDGMAHFTMEDGTESVLTWEQVGDYLNQPIRVFTDAQLAEAEAAEMEIEEARQRNEYAETNEDMDKVEEAVEDAEELEEEANPVHIPMNPDGTVNTDLFWDQNPEEWVKWNDEQRQDGGVDSMAQIAAGLQTAEAKLAEASKLPFATPTQREARDKEMGFWQDKINRYNALLEQYQLAAAAKEAQMARAYAAERLEAAEAALADKMTQAPKRSDYRFTPQYMQAKQKFDAEVASLQEEVARWQNELAQYGEMPVQQEEVAPVEDVSVIEEQQEEAVPTAEELAAQLDAMLMTGASRSDEAVVAAMQAYADAIASGVPAQVVTRSNVMQVLKDAGVSETKMAEVKDALRRIQYIVNGFEANGVAYILADSVIISDNLRSTYVHERQHVMTALSGIDAALMTMTSREELQSAIAKMVGSDFYNGKSHKVLADELISMAMERAYKGENLDEVFERIGFKNENAINFIKDIDNAQRNDSGLSLARVAGIGGNAAEGGSRQDGRTALSGSTEVGEQGPRSVGRGGETAGDNASGRGVGFSVSPNAGVAEMIENENGEAIAETNGGGGVRFSVLTYEQGGRDYLVNWLRKSKYMSKEERDFIIATLDQQYELAKRLGEEFPAFGAWSSAEVNVDKDGNPVMSVIKANGDYSMNLDFSLICKKRRPLNALLDVMIADRMLDMRSLNEAEIAKINKVIQRHGFEVACALCFVDSKRYRVVKVATDFADLYNELVESLIPEGSGIEAVESNYAGYEYINERNAEKTGRRLETVPDAELNWAKVDEILEGVKTPKSVEEKVAWMLRNNPSQRKLVNATDFVTNLGFESVKKNNPELLKVYNAKKGTGGPKASFGDVQYLNDILKSRSFTPKRAYSVGGVRVQSFSDYMGHMFFDYMQMVAELSAKGLPAHAYTKEEAFVRIFGMTGMKINMSLVPAVADDGVAPGLDAQGNYVWAVPYTDENGNEIQGQTFPPEVAFELQRDPRYSKNVGIIAVGVSDEHILKMLNDDEIHFIIPYHKSSLNPEVAKMTKIDKYADYTNVQNTRLGWEFANLDKDQKKAELKKRAFDFYKSLAQTKDPKATAAEYLEHCRQNGLIPKYDQFSGHENYYKLLVDFNTYDFNTGEYAPQGPVTMTFPEELESLVKASVASNEELESDLKDKVGKMAEDVKAELGGTRYSVVASQQDTRFSVSNNNQEIFVSNAAKAVEGIKQEKATPAQWLAMLEKNGGLKAAEDKWMGLSDWLKASDKKTLTKAEVLEFVNEHAIKIEETHYDAYAEEKVADAHAEMERILQDKFNAYREEYYEQNEDEDLYGNPANDYAIERLREELGDEFPYAIEVTGAGDVYLTFPYEEDEDMRKWSEKLGVEYNPQAQIEDMRMRYTTDGLTNKREIALTVPTIEPWGEEDITHFGDAGDGRAVAWVRFGETTDESGNKVLVIDEIQSKRHQEGREKGYRPGEDTPVVRELNRLIEKQNDARNKYYAKIREIKAQEGVTTWGMTDEKRWEQADEEFAKIRKDYHSASSALSKYQEEHQKELYSGEIPDAPFEKNWHELAMKRMLRYAAENGYDYIAWTKGDQQAERYNIGEVVEEISLLGWRTEGKDFLVKLNESDILYEINTSNDAIIESASSVFGDVSGKPLSDIVGKEMADKMMSMHEDEKLAGEALRVGGEGMKGFYDKMLPAFMNKYGKKWGVKVEDITLPNVEEAGRVMHSVPVTDAMKESVMEGQVMFSIGMNAQTEALNAKQTKVSGGILSDAQLEIPEGTDMDLDLEADDEHIRFSITKNNKATIEGWLSKRADLTDEEKSAFMRYIDDRVPKQQLAMGRWFAKGMIRIPQDLRMIDQAFALAEKMKADPMKYETPAAIAKDYHDRFGEEMTAERTDYLSPDDARFDGILTNKVDMGNGIVVYDVKNDMTGRNAVREIMNDHLGKDFNCWCLLYANANGEPTPGSEAMWWHYNKTQKKVAFNDGIICAFCASENRGSEWWSLHDVSFGKNIPVEKPVEGDELGRSTMFALDNGKLVPVKGQTYFRGNRKTGTYEEWANEVPNSLTLRTERKGGLDNGAKEVWDGNGNLIYRGNYKKGKKIGHHTRYGTDGQVLFDATFDKEGDYIGDVVAYFDNGQLKSRRTFDKNGKAQGDRIEYDEKGNVVYSGEYKDGYRVGKHVRVADGKEMVSYHQLEEKDGVVHYSEREDSPNAHIKRYVNSKGESIDFHFTTKGLFRKTTKVSDIAVRIGKESVYIKADEHGYPGDRVYQVIKPGYQVETNNGDIEVNIMNDAGNNSNLYVFNRRGKLKDVILENGQHAQLSSEEADAIFNDAKNALTEAKDRAKAMYEQIVASMNEAFSGDVRFSVVPHESSMDEVDSMFKQYNGDPFVRELYGKVSELAHTMGLKISFAEGMGRRSGLNALDKIKYNVDYFNSPGVYAQDKAKTLLHELIHAVTRYAIYAKDAEFMNPRLKDAVSQLETIYDEIKNDPAFEDMYGATSVEEMVSELANVRFRAKLREKNLLQRIVDAIKDLLGIDRGTKALDNLSATLEDMIVNFDRAAYEQVRKDVSTQENYMRFSVDPAVRAEMDVIKATAMVNGNYMKAPNGQPTKLTEDQWALVRTNNFKNWFGDWENDPENASKVVDENGEPMVVYHGTGYEGNVFTSGFFASDEQFATDYGFAGNGFNSRVVSAFIKMANPRVVDADYANYDEIKVDEQTLSADDLVRETKKDGVYDGLIIKNVDERSTDGFNWTDDIIPFAPSQIKSATDNTGEFSESEDIRFSTGDFGEIYEQFRGKPKEAIAFLMEKQSGEAVGALYHPEIGEIDLVWGEAGTGKSDGYGLAKLVKFHPEVINNLQEILSEMQIVKQSANRVNLESDKYQAAVRLTWNNKAKKWLLTAFEKKNSALGNTTDTGETSNGSKQNDTATLQSTVSDSKGTNNFESASESGENIAFSVRTKPAPKEVKRAYKLFNVDGEGKPHALFIDGANALDEKVWYDADSPLIKDLENLESGYTYYVDKDGNAERKTYKNKKQSPSKEELADAAAKGGRYIYVGTYANGEKSYYNWGVNGGKNGGSVSQFAMRPGWHLTDSPSARHIGAGRNPQAKQEAMYRKPNQRWFEVEYAADVDYNEEAQTNPTGDIQTHIPEDGYYSFKTNTAANDVNQNWIISGAIRIVKPLTREQVSKLNEENGVPDDLDYENGTMFSVSERPVDETVNDGVQKVSEEGKKAKASLKQRMDDIDSKLYYVMRLVANAQKNYDKKTVDIMTNLAKELMRDGALSDPTRGEINRLLSAIKNATGKADLTAAATTLMDVMVSNQLRHAKNTLAQMLKIKAKKVNASGVEVQGTLDLVGQRLIATVKESVGLTMEQIDERIADAKEKMDSEFDTIKNNAAIDLVGLNIARKYVEGIVASEAEEKDLRKELESAQEDKKAGKMTTEALREFRKATEDAIRQNRMERTSAYRSILSEMAKLITESVTKAGEFRNAEKERVEKIHHYANSDMQGMDAAEHVNNDQRLTNNPILRFFLKPLGTMDQMLRQMGSKHVNGEGYLWNHFMRGWIEATEKEYLGVSAAHKALDAKAKEVFGVKRWSDIFSIVRSLPSMHVEFWDGGKMRDHVLTQGNLLYIYMVNKMSDGKMKLRRMGIEEEQVRQMSMFMDPRLIEVGEWLQNEFLPSLRDKYNALHEKMFGAPMAAIDSYFPIKVLANARTREVDVATPEAEAKASTITGAIIKRTKNSLALDVLGSDALDVVLGHIQEMEHWAAFAEWNRDLNTLLSYKKFRNRVQNMSGLYGSGSTAWKNFRDACEVAAGVYKPASSGDAIDKTALNLAKGVTTGKISFRVFTAIKQLLSMPAFVSDADMMELGKSIATPWKSWNWAMEELPLFQKRWLSRQAGDSRLMATESDWKLWKTNFVEAASRYGMAPNAFVDALTVSIGAKAIYETKLAKYIENGYSVDAAEKKAKQDATILFNESQQSNEGAFLSAMQVDRSWISVALTVFRNSSMGYQRMLVDALRNIKHRMTKGYKEESIEFMAKQMVRDGLSEGQAQRAAERMYNRGFWHSMMRVGTFGFLVQFAWNLGAYLPYLVLGADDDEKEKMLKDASTHALLGGFVEGLSAGSLISEASNLIASGEGLKDYDPNLMPVVSDIKRLVQLWGTDAVAAANETLNLLGQMAIGVNPQTLTDIGAAIYDACDGDPQTAREATLLLARILQVPQSQTERIFIDEIDFTVDKALDLTIEEFAQRYARYKRLRNTPVTGWMYSDEEERKVEDRYIKRFTERAEELKRTRGNEEAKAWYNYVDNEYKEIDQTIRELRSGAEKAAKKEDRVSVEEFAAKMQELMQTQEFERYQQRAGKVKAVERLRQAMKDYPTKRDTLEDRMLEIRKQLVEEMRLAE